MFKFYLIIISSSILLLLFSSCASHSEVVVLYSGKLDVNLDDKSVIVGRVVNKNTNEPLVNANIIIDSTYLGSGTDYNGNYKLTKIPSGIYNIKVSAIGFESIKLENFKIDEGHRYLIDFFLIEIPVGPLIL